MGLGGFLKMKIKVLHMLYEFSITDLDFMPNSHSLQPLKRTSLVQGCLILQGHLFTLCYL